MQRKMQMPNVLVRTLSGALFVAVIVGCILFGMTTFCLLFAVVTALLLSEFNELLAEHDLAQVNSTVSIVSGVYLFPLLPSPSESYQNYLPGRIYWACGNRILR